MGIDRSYSAPAVTIPIGYIIRIAATLTYDNYNLP